MFEHIKSKYILTNSWMCLCVISVKRGGRLPWIWSQSWNKLSQEICRDRLTARVIAMETKQTNKKTMEIEEGKLGNSSQCWLMKTKDK